MAFTLALAGDTMLGRAVADRLREAPPDSLFAPEVRAAAGEADVLVLNLECCISDRGVPWPDPRKPFFFRAPPVAAEALAHLGVDCVSLANNHALDFGAEALLDTTAHLSRAGIRWAGAGEDLEAARTPAILEVRGFRLAVIGVADHPQGYAAGGDSPGIAFADLAHGAPAWVSDAVARAEADAVLVTPHWGPNMVRSPVPHVRAAAGAFVDAGAALVAGHSAHVFHGVERRVLYDIGDFLDDYAVDPLLRNDLGLLFLVTLEGGSPVRLEAIPLKLEFCHTRLAEGDEASWIRGRFGDACAALGTDVAEDRGRVVVTWP